MIKSYAYNKPIIILSSLCYLFSTFLMVAAFIFPYGSAFFIAFMISSIVLFALILVIQIYIFRKGFFVYFNEKGVSYELNAKPVLLTWNQIISIYRYGWIYFVDQNKLEIVYKVDNKNIVLSDIGGCSIHLSRKKYIKVIKLIPKSRLEEEKFLIYSNLYEYEKDPYHIYK